MFWSRGAWRLLTTQLRHQLLIAALSLSGASIFCREYSAYKPDYGGLNCSGGKRVIFDSTYLRVLVPREDLRSLVTHHLLIDCSS